MASDEMGLAIKVLAEPSTYTPEMVQTALIAIIMDLKVRVATLERQVEKQEDRHSLRGLP